MTFKRSLSRTSTATRTKVTHINRWNRAAFVTATMMFVLTSRFGVDALSVVRMDLERPDHLHVKPFRMISTTQNAAQHRLSHEMPWRSSIDPSYQQQPYYLPFWEYQMSFMKNNLSHLQALPVQSNSGQDMSYVENDSMKMRMHTMHFSSDEYKLIRLTFLDGGQKTQVFTSLWYPRANLPVLGCDFLAFNNKRLCVMDFQPIQEREDQHDQLYEHLMMPIRSKYPSLQGEITNRFYDRDRFFSKQMLLGRSSTDHESQYMVFGELAQAFQEYLQLHVSMVQSHPMSDCPDVQKRHAAYDTYSAARDPAHGLLAKAFGPDWANHYVHDILFPQSQQQSYQV